MRPALRTSPRWRLVALLAVALPCGATTHGTAEKPEFLDVISGRELDLTPQPGETLTDAVLEFRASGHNRYRGDDAATEQGRRLYMARCAFCHGQEGDGSLGPPLTGPDYTYNTSASDVGMFSIIHGGAYGAMASFARRGLQQDQILKIIAHIRSLSADAGNPAR
jgi:cytochrome c-L